MYKATVFYFSLFLLILFASCGKTENHIRPVEPEIDNTQNNITHQIQKKEPILSYNSEPEKFTVMEIDMPTIFIMTGGNIEVLMEYDRVEGSYLFIDLETSDYLIFRKWNFLGGTLETRDSVIYRKKDRRFFNFHADGGNGNLLYIINYKTRTFDFFEITDNGAKNDIASVPIPNPSDNWSVINDKLLASVFFGTMEIYKLDGIYLEEYAKYPSSLQIMGDSGLAYYFERSSGTIRAGNTILVDLYSLKEISIRASLSLRVRTKESLFFIDVDRLGCCDIQTGIYSLMEGIIADENTKIGDSFRLSDFFIQGYNEYPITEVYRFKNNQLLFNSRNRICMFDFDIEQLYILFDYNIYPDSEIMHYLYLINDNYFSSRITTAFGISDLVSLDDKRIIYRFILNWIDRTKGISDIADIKYYETREGDIIIYQTYNTNISDK
jgi:hypothetical protein